MFTDTIIIILVVGLLVEAIINLVQGWRISRLEGKVSSLNDGVNLGLRSVSQLQTAVITAMQEKKELEEDK